jgi:hypothetical protein
VVGEVGWKRENNWNKNLVEKKPSHQSSLRSEISCGMCVAHRHCKGASPSVRSYRHTAQQKGNTLGVRVESCVKSAYRSIPMTRPNIRYAPDDGFKVFGGVSEAARVSTPRGVRAACLTADRAAETVRPVVTARAPYANEVDDMTRGRGDAPTSLLGTRRVEHDKTMYFQENSRTEETKIFQSHLRLPPSPRRALTRA